MGLIIAVFSGYVLAAAAPWLQRSLAGKAGIVISALPLFLTAYFAALIPGVLEGRIVEFSLPWIPDLGIGFSFYLDGLSLLFALLISGIGTLVLFYTGSYLKGHPDLGRFYSYMLIFMASMLGLVLSGNILLLIIFWELTSISSFLLIGFNHYRNKSRYAALQALLITSSGGLALMAGMIMIGIITGETELSGVLAQRDLIQNAGLYLPVAGLMLAGAFTKSAQFPFHFWLPNAMEAPTPVSAYLHSATMVKAGIYLLARFSPVMSGPAAWDTTVTTVGAVTMLAGAFLALNHWDKKRILAYSTISGLGMMTMLLGIGSDTAIQAALVFLAAHALYKGALFLVAGAVEHETGSRNVNILRGLGRKMPVTAAAAILSGLSMAGIPPLLGFVAKEIFLESVRQAVPAVLITTLTVISSAALATVAYIVAVRVFFGKESHTHLQPHEPPLRLWTGPLILALLSLSFGIMPGLLNGILSFAASAAGGRPIALDLSLWHGWTFELALSAVTVAAGVLIYFSHDHLKRAWRDLRRIAFQVTPEIVYKLSLSGMIRVAGLQSRILQNGHLRNYTMTILLVLVFLTGFTILRFNWDSSLSLSGNPSFVEYMIALVMLAAALAATRLSLLLSAVVAMGIVGYGVALIYILFQAPDLAMTQLMVETLTVILLVLGFFHLPQQARRLKTGIRTGSLIAAVLSGALITVLMILVINSRSPSALSSYFAENSFTLADGRNVVNVILVDFRALDTLGETVVLAVAGIGVFALLKKHSGKDNNRP